MSKRRIRIVVAGRDAERSVAEIRRQFPTVLAEACHTGRELTRLTAAFKPSVAFVTKSSKIDRGAWMRLIDAPQLEWLNLGNIGFDHVPAWDRGKLAVTNSAGAGADAMAEYVMAAIMMANTGFVTYRSEQEKARWKPSVWSPLSGKTLVAVGSGHIGQAVMRQARRNEMRVIAVRRTVKRTPGADACMPISRLAAAVRAADFVSVQVPLVRETEGLIGRDVLNQMPRRAWLINVSRGAVIDQKALTEALQERRIAGAVLDVFEREPLPRSSPLWTLRNSVVTPHISGEIEGFDAIITDMFCANLRRFAAGRPLLRRI